MKIKISYNEEVPTICANDLTSRTNLSDSKAAQLYESHY